MGSAGVRAPIRFTSGMGHWKRLTKIPNGADCYYCIDNMTCLIHVYHCSLVLVTIPDSLSTIMSPVYLVSLPDTCYTSCGDILSCTDILCNSMYVVSCIPCRHYYCIITAL